MLKKQSKSKASERPSLLKAVLQDFFVTHWLLTLFGFVFLISAMMLAYKTHDVRSLTASWESLVKEQQQQQAKWDALHLELSSLSESDRISNLAKKKLGMKRVNSTNEQVISL